MSNSTRKATSKKSPNPTSKKTSVKRKSSRAARTEVATAAPKNSVATPTSRVTRKSALLALLQRPEGAVLDELVAATGWQLHSVRAALTHFRKAGHDVMRQRDEQGSSRYRLTAA